MIRQIALLSVANLAVVCGLPQPATFDLSAAGITDSFATLSCAPDASPAMVKLTRLLPKILANAKSSSTKSWEIGTLYPFRMGWIGSQRSTYPLGCV